MKKNINSKLQFRLQNEIILVLLIDERRLKKLVGKFTIKTGTITGLLSLVSGKFTIKRIGNQFYSCFLRKLPFVLFSWSLGD